MHGQALGSEIFIAFLYDNFSAEMRGHLILLHFLKANFLSSVKFAGSLDFIAFLKALRRDGMQGRSQKFLTGGGLIFLHNVYVSRL